MIGASFHPEQRANRPGPNPGHKTREAGPDVAAAC